MVDVLVIDAGGRGNAIAHGLSNSGRVDNVYVAPGNAGVQEYGGECVELSGEGKRERVPEVVEKAEDLSVDLVVPGPEGWISAGVVDEFRERTDIPVLGPTRRASFLETSKCDAKDYLNSIGVPVPLYRNFDEPGEAEEWAKEFYAEDGDSHLVPKADGIAAGKGAFVCDSLEETVTAISRIASEEFNEEFDGAGDRIEIEERLDGVELSFFAITDGETVLPFGTARDYKRRFEREDHPLVKRYFDGINPNTGGMGAYSPHRLGEELEEEIMQEVAEPTVENLDEEYVGILHFVLMVLDEGDGPQPYVLEINVRDGDPEAQARLPRLESDLFELYMSAATRELEGPVSWRDESCVGVCAVSGPPFKGGQRVGPGYPGEYLSKQTIFLRGEKERRIGREGIGSYVDGFVYHNGTDLHRDSGGDEYLRSRGGRVLTFTDTGDDLEEAREKTYSDVDEIFFSFMDYREDIGEESP